MNHIMKKLDKSENNKKATSGRRWHGTDLKKIDGWASEKGITRSEAIGRLIELGLLKMKSKKRLWLGEGAYGSEPENREGRKQRRPR
jgi:hypothetical protein